MPLRPAIFQFHVWTGLIAGLYVTVVCVTGAALVFRIDLQRAMHPDLFTPSASGPPADPVDVMERVQTAYPGDRVSGVDAPTTWRPTYLAYSSHDGGFRTLLLDPVTAALLGELDDRSFVRTLQDLHFDLLAGRTGRLVNGAGAVCLLAMCVTGAVIWWPGRRQWRRGLMIDVTRPWKRVIWEAHGAVGVWSVALIAMWAVTGAAFAFPAGFRSAVNWISPITVARQPQSGPRVADASPAWRTLVDRARRHAPAGHHVARIVLPGSERAPFLVMFSDRAPAPPGAALVSVYLDRYTGALLASPSPRASSLGDTIMAWAAPLHVGNFAGNVVRVLWFLFGLAPPLLFATGFTMWWTRVVRPRAQRAAARSASSVA